MRMYKSPIKIERWYITLNKTNVGLYWALVGLSFYTFLLVAIVFQLPQKIDTFIVFSWVVLPGVIGGTIFQFMDKKGMFKD